MHTRSLAMHSYGIFSLCCSGIYYCSLGVHARCTSGISTPALTVIRSMPLLLGMPAGRRT